MRKSFAAAAVFQAVLFGGAAIGAVGSDVRVAHAQAVTISVGVLDEDKLAEGYKVYRDAIARVDEKAKQYDAQLSARAFLTGQDATTFDTLVSKTRAGNEIKTFTDLVAKGTSSSIDYTTLIAQAVKTPAETDRMKKLLKVQQDNGEKLRIKSDELYNKIKKEQEETDKTYTDRANEVIAAVAGRRKFSVIVRQRAVVWSDPKSDITVDVLADLNK